MATLVPFLLIFVAGGLTAAAERAILTRRPMRVIVFGAPALAVVWIALCVTVLGLTP